MKHWPSYPAYRDTGIPRLGKIPEHWEHRRIKLLCNVQRGASPRPIDDPGYFDDFGEYAWVRISDVTSSSKYLLKTEQRLSDQGKSRSIPIEPGELIVSIAATIGKPIITGIKCCIHDGLVWLKGLKRSRDYFFYLLSDEHIYAGLGKTGTQLNLNSTFIGNIEAPLPSLLEQHAIAVFLDCQTARIDALIAKKQRLIELLHEKRAALISQVVTKGLDLNSPMKDSGTAWLGMIPAHWGLERNKWLYAEINERSEKGEEELLTVSHITGITPRSEKEVNMFMAETLEGYKVCKLGDLVLNTMWAWMGALGFSPYHGVVSPSYNVYRLRKDNGLLPKYLDYLYRTPQHIMEITRFSNGVWTSRLRLYPTEFFLMMTPIPPYEDQLAFVDYLDREVKKLDELSRKIQIAIGKLQEYRTALISTAVTGKIDIRMSI